MIDLDRLRPRDGSAAAIGDALQRTSLAAKGAAAEIARLRASRDNLLVVGTNEALAQAELELKQAAADGERVMGLHAQLEQMLSKAVATLTPAQREEAARGEATRAAAQFGQWWLEHQQMFRDLQTGLELLTASSAAMATWHQTQAAAALPPAPPSNLVPLRAPAPPASA